MTNEVHPTQQACLEAIDRIARTPDGATLYVFLQRRLMAVAAASGSGALRVDNGERSFASRLIGLMGKGIHESVRRNSSSDDTSSGTHDGEQPLVVPTAKPVRVSGTGGSRRRVGPDTIVPGWNDTPAG
jgi:hypothetical protein